MKHYLIILLLSILAILVHGYQFAVSDQEIFIPYILKSANPSLFPTDALFNQSSANLSLFYPLIGYLTKLFDIQIIFFLGYLIFQFAFFAGLYRLSNILLKSKRLAYFSLLPFLLPKFIGGTATQTFDLFFGYRSIGTIFLVFYLSFLLESKFTKAAIVAAVGALFHPLSIIPSVLLLPALYIKRFTKIKLSPKYIFLFSALFLTILTAVIKLEVIKNLKDDEWLSIIMIRDDYLFISTWPPRAWGAFALYFVLVAFLMQGLAKKFRNPIIIVCAVSFVLFVLNSLVLEVIKIPQVAQLQLVRSISPIAHIALAVSPMFLVYKKIFLKVSGFLAFVFLSLNLFFPFLVTVALFTTALYLLKDAKETKLQGQGLLWVCTLIAVVYASLNTSSYLNLNNKFQFPKRGNDWIELQKWANQNTDKSSKFLVPPDQTGFRIFSERPIVGDIKDGAAVIYSPKYALYWNSLMADLKDYDNYGDEDFFKLKDKYNFNYIVTKKDDKLNLSPIYKNNTYSLYKL